MVQPHSVPRDHALCQKFVYILHIGQLPSAVTAGDGCDGAGGKSLASRGPVVLARQMRIEPWIDDETTALGCYEVHRAANLADEPMEPPMSAGTFGLFLRQGFEKTPGETWVASDADGGIVGFYRMHLWDLENLDRASIGPVITPGGAATRLRPRDAPRRRRRGPRRTGGRC